MRKLYYKYLLKREIKKYKKVLRKEVMNIDRQKNSIHDSYESILIPNISFVFSTKSSFTYVLYIMYMHATTLINKTSLFQETKNGNLIFKTIKRVVKTR